MQKFMDGPRHGMGRLVLIYLACYSVWLAVSGLAVWTVLLLRNGLLGLLPVIGPWIMGAVDKFGFLLFGVVLLVWLLYTENALRTSVERGQLKQQTIRIGGVQLVVLASAYLFQLLSPLFA